MPNVKKKKAANLKLLNNLKKSSLSPEGEENKSIMLENEEKVESPETENITKVCHGDEDVREKISCLRTENYDGSPNKNWILVSTQWKSLITNLVKP